MRVRFAPSPTGLLHLGGARTALINYLFAKNQKGVFILRVEDTDLTRSSDEFLKKQLQDLQWLGLNWEEGLFQDLLTEKGNYGPYRQSLRKSIYKKYAEQLIRQNQAYYCFLSDQEIEEQKTKALQQKKPIRVVSPYREQSLSQAQEKLSAGQKAVVRFKVPLEKKDYIVQDLVRGAVRLPSDMVGDFVILKSNGLPVYNFACVVDDHLMKISHVFRSEEHLANTLRQLLLYSAFSWPLPLFAHLSIILGADGKKLSKRKEAVSCSEYKAQGFLPSALLNFLALMGWNPKTKQEVFSIQELIENFSLKGLNSAPALFDKKKLEWMQARHIQKMDPSLLWQDLQSFFKEENFQFPVSRDWPLRAVEALKNSFSTLQEAKEVFQFLSENHFSIHSSAREPALWENTQAVWSAWESLLRKEVLSAGSEKSLSAERFSQFCKEIMQKTGVKGRKLFMPLRATVLGQASGAELKLIVPLISIKTLLKRVQLCRKHFECQEVV